jgi:cyclohexyl-isocyanide hydratase
VLFPGFTLLDLIGPHAVWAWHTKIHLVAKTRDVVPSDSGIGLQPTATFDDCPEHLDVLFVPGGMGTAGAMADGSLLGFLTSRAVDAAYITSVCSGSLILGAAGLLRGYKATSHWTARDALAQFGAEPVRSRVVIDRNRVTGGGVTAGLDFGLVLLAIWRGDEVAKLTQLAMEYDPAPPFDAGSPETAGPELTAVALGQLEAARWQIGAR